MAIIPVFVFDGSGRPSVKRGKKVLAQSHWMTEHFLEFIDVVGFYSHMVSALLWKNQLINIGTAGTWRSWSRTCIAQQIGTDWCSPYAGQLVMDTGTATHDGSRVWGTTGQVQVRKILPVMIPYPFGRVMGMWQITSTFCYDAYHHLTHTQRSTTWTPDDTKMGGDKRWQ